MGPQLSSSSVCDLACSGAHPRCDLALSSLTSGWAAQRWPSSPRKVAPPISPTGPGCVPPAPLPSLLHLQRYSFPPCPAAPPLEVGPPAPFLPWTLAPRAAVQWLSSLAAGCPSPLRSWGPPSRSPPPIGSSPPWAAPGGTPGATAPVPDSGLATLLVPGLLCSASPRCNGATDGLEVTATAMAPGSWYGPATGSRQLSPSASVTLGGF